MSLHSNYPESRRTSSYRYIFQHGDLNLPGSGECRGFDEVEDAIQYMDENREHAQAAANETGEVEVLQVIDQDSYGKERIVAIAFFRPMNVSERAAFVRTDRPKLSDLELVSMLEDMKKRCGGDE